MLVTVRARYLVGSVVVDGLVAGMVLVLAVWASRPILWPSDPLFPRFFFSYFAGVYGWLLIACAAGLSTVLQAVFTQWSLRLVGRRPSGWVFLVVGLVVLGILSAIVAATFMGDVAMADVFVLAVGILLPAFWPSYVVVRRWERQHQQILLLRGFSYHAAPKR
jgi:hypothetical protein